jgi:hypothetical protein
MKITLTGVSRSVRRDVNESWCIDPRESLGQGSSLERNVQQKLVCQAAPPRLESSSPHPTRSIHHPGRSDSVFTATKFPKDGLTSKQGAPTHRSRLTNARDVRKSEKRYKSEQSCARPEEPMLEADRLDRPRTGNIVCHLRRLCVPAGLNASVVDSLSENPIRGPVGRSSGTTYGRFHKPALRFRALPRPSTREDERPM